MIDTLMTEQGFAQLESEYERLQAQRKSAIAWISAILTSGGDEATDSEYLLARDELALFERRLALLERGLRDAELAEADPTDGQVGIGEAVRVRNLTSGEIVDFRIVGRGEADPESGRISYRSPIGAALLGRRAGDLVELNAPQGRVRLEVLAAT